MRLQSHHLELLSPARAASIAREAILHGADAVYIGGPGFGARHNASNSDGCQHERAPLRREIRLQVSR